MFKTGRGAGEAGRRQYEENRPRQKRQENARDADHDEDAPRDEQKRSQDLFGEEAGWRHDPHNGCAARTGKADQDIPGLPPRGES